MPYKCCTKCGETKDLTEFSPNKHKRDGMQSNCKQCNRDIKEIRRRAKGNYTRDEYLRTVKAHKTKKKKITKKRKIELIKSLGGKCQRCGITLSQQYPSACFEFHHLRDKLRNVGSLLNNQGNSAFKKEAEKCQLLCVNCHRAIEYPATEADSI